MTVSKIGTFLTGLRFPDYWPTNLSPLSIKVYRKIINRSSRFLRLSCTVLYPTWEFSYFLRRYILCFVRRLPLLQQWRLFLGFLDHWWPPSSRRSCHIFWWHVPFHKYFLRVSLPVNQTILSPYWTALRAILNQIFDNPPLYFSRSVEYVYTGLFYKHCVTINLWFFTLDAINKLLWILNFNLQRQTHHEIRCFAYWIYFNNTEF